MNKHFFVKMCYFVVVPVFFVFVDNAFANMDAAKKWVENEFQPSTLTQEQQLDEIKWFINAAKPYKGMTIRVVSERIDTHWYEASVLAKAFREITGINLIHEITGEDDVVKKTV